MKTIKKITAFLFLLGIATSCTHIEKETPSETKPNIIIFLADDMGYSDLGIYGSEIQTPNIDKIASEGVQMTNFHVGAACSPTRTMLMTGVDNHRAGLGNMLEIQAENQFGQPGYEGQLNNNVISLASRIKEGGYHTYMVGKWHLGSTAENIPSARGFDESFALMESGADNWVNQPYAPLYKKVHYYRNDQEVDLPENYFSTDYYTDELLKYIDSNKSDEQPFFAYVAYQAVHMPHQAPKEFIDKYNGVYYEGWEQLRETRLNKLKETGVVSEEITLKDEFDATSYKPWMIPDWDALSDDEKKFNARRMQTYAGMVDNMDYNIGRVVEYLKANDMYENTVIIVMSDNGADPNVLPDNPAFQAWFEQNYDTALMEDYNGDYSSMGQKGSFSSYGAGWAAAANTPNSYYKTFSTEGGLRVPFIISYPNNFKTQKSSQFGYVLDIAPTVLDIAGVNYSKEMEEHIYPLAGSSMLSFFKGENNYIHHKNEAIGYELSGSSAVFKGDYKLTKNPSPKGNGQWELYNMITDPSEQNNLAEAMPELLEELIAAYAVYEKENGVIPVPADYDPVKQLVINSQRGVAH